MASPHSITAAMRPVLMAEAKRERDAFAAAIRAAAGPPPAGGSLPYRVANLTPRVKGATVVIPYASQAIPQALSFLLYGTPRQRARPAKSVTDTAGLSRDLERVSAQAVAAADREIV